MEKNKDEDTGIASYNEFIKSNIEDLFTKVSSIHKQKKTFKNNFNIIEPVRVHVGSTIQASNNNNNQVDLQEKQHLGYYIPFIPSLKKLLDTQLSDPIIAAHPNVFKMNVLDGELIKEKMKRKNTLAIAMYLDDLELVNVAGSGTKIHKQSKFYHIKYFKYIEKLFTVCI